MEQDNSINLNLVDSNRFLFVIQSKEIILESHLN